MTGEPAPQDVDLSRPAVAVKVENGAQARPQAGLEAADLVYEVPVEGGLAWFVAVFHCTDPSVVGPVRHAHPADAAILAGHAPVLFAHAGGGKAAAEALRDVEGVQDLDGAAHGEAFHRVDGRPVPHNLYASTQKLRPLTKGGRGPQPWARFTPSAGGTSSPAPTPSAKQRPVSSVRFTRGPGTVRWIWDKATRSYTRRQGSTPFTDADGRVLRVVNVIFLWVEMSDSGSRDAAGNPTPSLTLTGKGDVLVLHSGVEYGGRWTRASLSHPPRLVDLKGRPLALAPGPSWIHLMPSDVPVFVHR